LLSGPGAIATVMVLVGKSKTFDQRMGVHIAIFAISVVTFLILRSAALFARILGKTGINVIGRIMGLILAASSVQFVVDGLREAFPRVLG
jgi:multiple antibiotic resistance protein